MSAEAPPPKPADVGVLFVHGMGEQQRADTLIQFGEPLQRWLERWLRERDKDATVRVTRAELSESDEPRPARAELRIRANGSECTWLLAEAWWAGSFRAPTYSDLWRWSIGVVPVTVAEHFVRRFRRATGGYRKTIAWLVAGAAIVMLPLATLVMVTSLVIGVLPLARLRTAILRFQKILIGTVGDSYVLLESSIRDGAMSACVERDLRWLQTQAAKTVVVAHSQGAAVTHAALQATTVRPDLLFTFGSGLRKLLVLETIRGSNRFIVWLPPVGFLLMAVGSWLGYRLIVDPSARVDVLAYQTVDVFGYINRAIGFDILSWRVLLTIGAVVGGIVGAAVGDESIGYRVLGAALGALMGIFMASAFKAMLVTGPPLWFAGALIGVGIAAVQQGMSVLKDENDDQINKQLQLDPPVSWIDRYAASDPVPNGPLTDSVASFVDSRPVWNRNSTLRDHTSYWQNADQFVAAVAMAIADVAGVPLKEGWDEQRLLRAEQRRRWRVGWLTVLRIGALLVGGLSAWRFRDGPWHQANDMPWLPRTLFIEAVDLLEKIPFLRLLVTEWTKSALLQVLWPASLLVSVWLIYRFFAAAWTWWEHDDRRLLFLRRDYVLFSPAFVTTLAVVGAALAVSIGFASSFDHRFIELWTRDPLVRAAMKSEFWKEFLQATPEGALSASLSTLSATGVAAFLCAQAKILSVWRGRNVDSLWVSGLVLAYMVLALPFTVPAAWILFDLSGEPPSPPFPALLWNGLGAFVVLSALALAPILLASWALESRFGRALVDQLYRYSASGPLAMWLARRDSAGGATPALLAARAAEMVVEWNAVKHPDVRMTADYNREAVAIVQEGSLIDEPDQLLALTGAFPYAAIAAAEAVASESPDLARLILEPHRTNSPLRARWRIRRIDKRLAGTPPQAQAV